MIQKKLSKKEIMSQNGNKHDFINEFHIFTESLKENCSNLLLTAWRFPFNPQHNYLRSFVISKSSLTLKLSGLAMLLNMSLWEQLLLYTEINTWHIKVLRFGMCQFACIYMYLYVSICIYMYSSSILKQAIPRM